MKAKKALHLAELYIIEVDEHHAELHKRLLERIEKLEQSLRQFPVQAEPKIQVKDFGPPRQVIPQQPHEFAPVHPKFKPFGNTDRSGWKNLAHIIKEEKELIEKAVDAGTSTTPPTGQK